MSGETNAEESRRFQDQDPGQEKFSGDSEIEENVPDEEEGLEDLEDNSRNSEIDTYSDRNSSSESEMSELAIHTLLVETRASKRPGPAGISRP